MRRVVPRPWACITHRAARGVPVVNLDGMLGISHLQRRGDRTGPFCGKHDGSSIEEAVVGFCLNFAEAGLGRRVGDFRECGSRRATDRASSTALADSYLPVRGEHQRLRSPVRRARRCHRAEACGSEQRASPQSGSTRQVRHGADCRCSLTTQPRTETVRRLASPRSAPRSSKRAATRRKRRAEVNEFSWHSPTPGFAPACGRT